MPQRLKTISMRSINECPLGYVDDKMKFHDTGEFFAAYVNEEHPQIDKLLREALDTRLVNRFLGYQGDTSQSENVDKQVYALWNVLQKRNFKYSSTTNSSLSSNVVYTQRVRTLDDALESSQINCVDGSVLLASLLKIGDVNLDDFFPDEKLDSTMVGKSQNQMSKLTFEKSKEYANKKYRENESLIHSGKVNYMFLEIDKKTRAQVQPIGK